MLTSIWGSLIPWLPLGDDHEKQLQTDIRIQTGAEKAGLAREGHLTLIGNK